MRAEIEFIMREESESKDEPLIEYVEVGGEDET